MNSSPQNAGFCDVHSPLQGPKGTGRGASLFRPSRGANDGFVNQPSHAHQENGRHFSGIYWSGACPRSVTGLSATTRSPLSKAPAHGEPGKVVRSDGATVLETSSRRIRGFKRNGVYTFPPWLLPSAAFRKTRRVQLQRSIG